MDNKYRYTYALVMTQVLGLVTAMISSNQNGELLTGLLSQKFTNSVSVLIVVLMTYVIDLIFYVTKVYHILFYDTGGFNDSVKFK